MEDRSEGSWNFEPRVMIAYKPDPWSSYTYAGGAARATLCLERRDTQRATVYRDSALRAMRSTPSWRRASTKARRSVGVPTRTARLR